MNNLAFKQDLLHDDQPKFKVISSDYKSNISSVRLSYLYALNTENDLFTKLINDLYSKIQIKPQKPTHKNDFLNHIASFLFFCTTNKDKEISYPKHARQYIGVKISTNKTKRCRYFGLKGYSLQYTLQIVEYMQSIGYIKLADSNTGNNKEASFCVSEGLISMVLNAGVKKADINPNTELIRIKETGVARDLRVKEKKLSLLAEYKEQNQKLKLIGLGTDFSDKEILEKFCYVPQTKHFIDYKDTNITNKMRSNLEYINLELSKYNIDMPLNLEQIKDISAIITHNKNKKRKTGNYIYYTWSPEGLKAKYLYRSFSGDLKHGGRYYGTFWLNGGYCPKEYRPLITINNESTVEVDYKAFHPSILYCLEKLPIPTTDIYSIQGYDSSNRGIIKALMLLSLNNDNEKSTMAALNSDYKVDNGSRYTEQIPDFKYTTLRPLLDAIKATHEPIYKYLFSGIGLQLQYMDACLMESVLLKCFKSGFCALPIHDSVLVASKFQAYAQDILVSEFKHKFGQSIEVNIK